MSKFPKVYGEDNGRLGEAKGKLRTLKATMTGVPFASASAHGAYRVSKSGEFDTIELLGGDEKVPPEYRLYSRYSESIPIEGVYRTYNVIGWDVSRMWARRTAGSGSSYDLVDGKLNLGTLYLHNYPIGDISKTNPPLRKLITRTNASIFSWRTKNRVTLGPVGYQLYLPQHQIPTPPENLSGRFVHVDQGVWLPRSLGYFRVDGDTKAKYVTNAVCTHHERGTDYFRRYTLAPRLITLRSDGTVGASVDFPLRSSMYGHTVIAGTPVTMAPGRFAVLACQYMHPTPDDLGPGGKLWLYVFDNFGATLVVLLPVVLPELEAIRVDDEEYLIKRNNDKEPPVYEYLYNSVDGSRLNAALWNIVNGNGTLLPGGNILWAWNSKATAAGYPLADGTHAMVISPNSGDVIQHNVIWDSSAYWYSAVTNIYDQYNFGQIVSAWPEFTAVNNGATIVRIIARRSYHAVNPVKFFITYDQGSSFQELPMAGVEAVMNSQTVGHICVLDEMRGGGYSLVLPVMSEGRIAYYISEDNGLTWARKGSVKLKMEPLFFQNIYPDHIRTRSNSYDIPLVDYSYGPSRLFVTADPQGRRVPCDQIRPWVYHPEYKKP